MSVFPSQTELPRLMRHPRGFATSYRMPMLILTLGAAVDLYSTWHNLRLYGTSVEAHLVQRWVSDIVGIEAGVPLAKLAQYCFVVVTAAWWKPWTPWLLTVCGVLYSLAAMSNYFQWL